MAEPAMTDPFPRGAIARDHTAAFQRLNDDPGFDRREVGQLLFSALEHLAIAPDVLVWIATEDDVTLALVTSLVDRIESLKLYELLFDAQDRGLIDGRVPLMDVSLYSPHTELGLDLVEATERIAKSGDMALGPAAKVRVERMTLGIGFADPAYINGADVIAVKSSGYTAIQDLNRWHRATRMVAKAA